jgi:hypothetical protein
MGPNIYDSRSRDVNIQIMNQKLMTKMLREQGSLGTALALVKTTGILGHLRAAINHKDNRLHDEEFGLRHFRRRNPRASSHNSSKSVEQGNDYLHTENRRFEQPCFREVCRGRTYKSDSLPQSDHALRRMDAYRGRSQDLEHYIKIG